MTGWLFNPLTVALLSVALVLLVSLMVPVDAWERAGLPWREAGRNPPAPSQADPRVMPWQITPEEREVLYARMNEEADACACVSCSHPDHPDMCVRGQCREVAAAMSSEEVEAAALRVHQRELDAMSDEEHARWLRAVGGGVVGAVGNVIVSSEEVPNPPQWPVRQYDEMRADMRAVTGVDTLTTPQKPQSTV